MGIEYDLPILGLAGVELARDKKYKIESSVCDYFKRRISPPRYVSKEVSEIMGDWIRDDKDSAAIWEEIEKYKRDHIFFNDMCFHEPWRGFIGKKRPKLFLHEVEPSDTRLKKKAYEDALRKQNNEITAARSVVIQLLTMMRGYDTEVYPTDNTPSCAEWHYMETVALREPQHKKLHHE